MRVVYAVPHIEVEFGWGSRPEGYRIFSDLTECIKLTKEASVKASASGGDYYGPERPLHYYEVPFDSLPEDVKMRLYDTGSTWTEDRWSPQFKSNAKDIK